MDIKLNAKLQSRYTVTPLLVLGTLIFTVLMSVISAKIFLEVEWKYQNNLWVLVALVLQTNLVTILSLIFKKKFKGTFDKYKPLEYLPNHQAERLKEIGLSILQKSGIDKKVDYYVYPLTPNEYDANHYGAYFMSAMKTPTIYFAEKLLSFDDSTVSGILAHEIGHTHQNPIIMRRIMFVISKVSAVATLYPVFYLVTVYGWIWLLPVLISLTILRGFIINSPSRWDEDSADYFTSQLGYGDGMTHFLEMMERNILTRTSPLNDWIQTHKSNKTRIKQIRKWQEESQQ